jgi:hypothetical protein
VALTFEAVFSVGDEVLAEALSDFQFVPTVADYNLDLPPASTETSEILLLKTEEAEQTTTCGVCGDSLAGEPVTNCQVCGTSSHQECWNYMGGCSTYACEGRGET